MMDHIAIYVTDVDRSRRFYEQALAPLGYTVDLEMEAIVGFAHDGSLRFVIRSGKDGSNTAHVAFQAADRAIVDGFHAAAIAAGGRDNGRPGVREQYHPSYFAAFVADPDGNNIEAVCHKPA